MPFTEIPSDNEADQQPSAGEPEQNEQGSESAESPPVTGIPPQPEITDVIRQYYLQTTEPKPPEQQKFEESETPRQLILSVIETYARNLKNRDFYDRIARWGSFQDENEQRQSLIEETQRHLDEQMYTVRGIFEQYTRLRYQEILSNEQVTLTRAELAHQLISGFLQAPQIYTVSQPPVELREMFFIPNESFDRSMLRLPFNLEVLAQAISAYFPINIHDLTSQPVFQKNYFKNMPVLDVPVGIKEDQWKGSDRQALHQQSEAFFAMNQNKAIINLEWPIQQQSRAISEKILFFLLHPEVAFTFRIAPSVDVADFYSRVKAASIVASRRGVFSQILRGNS